MPLSANTNGNFGKITATMVLMLTCSASYAESDCRSLALASNALVDQMQPIQARIDAAGTQKGNSRSAAQVREICKDLRSLTPLVNRQKAMTESACFRRSDMIQTAHYIQTAIAHQEIKAALLNEEIHCGLHLEEPRVLLHRYEQRGLID